jgi:hypothetical protein
VVDADGTVLARGIAGGDPIPLPAGTYELRLTGGAMETVIAAAIRPGSVTTVSP